MTLDRLDGNSEGFVRPWYQVSAITGMEYFFSPLVSVLSSYFTK